MAAKNKPNKNSSPYDWFQYGSNKQGGGIKKPPSSFRSALKILKIFTYMSLLILSLTGCVQSMVIRTGTKTGSGLEFYNSTSQIAPYTNTFNFVKSHGDEKSLALDAEKNYWIKDPSDLKSVHSTIEKASGTFSGNRAWKAQNEALRFDESNNLTKGNSNLLKGENDSVFAISTSQTSYIPLYNTSLTPKDGYFTILIPNITDDKNSKNEISRINNSNIYNTKSWKVSKVSYNFNKQFPNNNDFKNNAKKALEDRFSYDLYFELLAYIYNQNLNIQSLLTQQWNNPEKNGEIKGDSANEIKSFIDSYVSLAAITNWYVHASKTEVTQDKNPSAAPVIYWSNIPEERAITSWTNSWRLGPFYFLFVYPMSKLTSGIVGSMPELAGWESVITIFLVVLILRSFAYLLSFKSTLQQVKQQEVQVKIAQINAKYEPYKGNRQMDNRKKQETMDVYKKEGISPLGAFASTFLTMPIFLSMWRVIGSTPYLKSTSVGGVVFAATSYQRLLAGEFQYLFVMVLASSLQVVSVLLPRWLSKRRDRRRINIHQQSALKKQNRTQTILAVVFAVIAAIMPAGVSIYMIFTSLYQVGQNSLNHKIIKWQSIKKKRAKGVRI